MKKVHFCVLLLAVIIGVALVSPVFAQSSAKGTAVLALTGNDAMQFDKKELKAKAGQKVKLTLKHVGKFAKMAMGHNFVLLKPGVDIADFASKANLARDNEYIPKSEATKIIAHTKLLGGGESDTIEFTAPKKGTYTYICSFPGHYGLMQGKFMVD